VRDRRVNLARLKAVGSRHSRLRLISFAPRMTGLAGEPSLDRGPKSAIQLRVRCRRSGMVAMISKADTASAVVPDLDDAASGPWTLRG
jgi:hypothetical protein